MAQASTCIFLFAHLRAANGGWQGLSDRLPELLAGWPQAKVFGSFMGLFGIRNHDLFVLLSVPGPGAPETAGAAETVAAGQTVGTGQAPGANEFPSGHLRRCLPADIELIETIALNSTVRPSTDEPLNRNGVFVFRFFDVRNADVEEIVRLSNTAWQTFEQGDGYTSEPVALFRSADRQAERGRMLLLTWYDNFTSWERSRSPHPEATANFRRRAALSKSVIAYATRLAHTVAR